MSRLSQETLAIIGVGVALAALILTVSVDVRGEFQSVRAEFQSVRAEIQTVRDELRNVRTEARTERQAIRAEARAERQAIRAEARADREAMRAAHETFQNHILRLTEQQGILRARLDGLSDPPAASR